MASALRSLRNGAGKLLASVGGTELESLAAAQGRIEELQAAVSSLQERVESLEAENLRLRSTVDAVLKHENAGQGNDFLTDAAPMVQEIVPQRHSEAFDDSEPGFAAVEVSRKERRRQRRKTDMSHYQRRHVALKIMYIGSRYYGFASQPGSLRTVESELFAALEHTMLLLGSRAEASYSRCGRTDRGVSASGQVVALYIRSKQKQSRSEGGEDGECNGAQGDKVAAAKASRSQEEEYAGTADEREVDYVGVLNRALPQDIRVLGWCPVPDSFSARFSCLCREYRYFFLDEGLDIERMQQTCGKFLGEHDFRNFCKMDAANVHNYVRCITEIGIFPATQNWPGMRMWMLKLRGNAFLWHQVRCIASILFMVGSGKEPPSIVDDLLDVKKTSRKPQYVMASELPLLLHTCAFQGLSFKCSPEAARQLRSHMRSLLKDTLVSAQLLQEALSELPATTDLLDNSTKTGGKSKHISIMMRPTEPTYEDRQRKISQVASLQNTSKLANDI